MPLSENCENVLELPLILTSLLFNDIFAIHAPSLLIYLCNEKEAAKYLP
jgi:hypothetical protein